MRMSVRKIVKAGVLFTLFMLINVLYLSFVDINRSPLTLGTERESELGHIKHPNHGGNSAIEQQDTVREKLNSAPSAKDVAHYRGKRDVKNLLEEVKTFDDRDQTTLREQTTGVNSRRTRPTELEDVYISVKTTHSYHRERVQLLLDTWAGLARQQTFFFTDAEDEVYQKKTGGHLINTNCSSLHTRRALCCKMAAEFDYFIESGKRWFCHVDDDTYVNVMGLLDLLRQYNHTDDWYLGKPSLNHPVELSDVESPQQKIAFWFATGGAGFCISQSLAMKMMPYAGGGRLQTQGDRIRLPDDCTIGYIIYYYLHKKLTVIDGFHSHLEGLWIISSKNLHKQITYSYANNKGRMNIVEVSGYDIKTDPTRFKSIHCHLNPHLKQCRDFR